MNKDVYIIKNASITKNKKDKYVIKINNDVIDYASNLKQANEIKKQFIKGVAKWKK